MKFEFYNENSEMGSEKLLQFKSEMEKIKETMIKDAEIVMEKEIK